MVVVPSSTAQVSGGSFTAPRVVPPANVAGGQIARFGQAMQQTGESLTRAGIEAEERFHVAAVKEAQALAEERILDADRNYRNQLGKNALGSRRTEAWDDLKKKLEAIEQGLGHETQRRLFREVARRRLLAVRGVWDGHEDRQLQAYELGAREAVIAAKVEAARWQGPQGAAGGDISPAIPESVKARLDAGAASTGRGATTRRASLLDSLKTEVRALANDLGYGPEQTAALVREQTTRVHAGVVEDLLVGGQSTQAQEYLSGVDDDELDPDTRAELQAHVTRAVLRDDSLRLSLAITAQADASIPPPIVEAARGQATAPKTSTEAPKTSRTPTIDEVARGDDYVFDLNSGSWRQVAVGFDPDSGTRIATSPVPPEKESTTDTSPAVPMSVQTQLFGAVDVVPNKVRYVTGGGFGEAYVTGGGFSLPEVTPVPAGTSEVDRWQIGMARGVTRARMLSAAHLNEAATDALNQLFLDGKINADLRDMALSRIEHEVQLRRQLAAEHEDDVRKRAEQWASENRLLGLSDMPPSLYQKVVDVGLLVPISSFMRNNRYVTEGKALAGFLQLTPQQLRSKSRGELEVLLRPVMDDRTLAWALRVHADANTPGTDADAANEKRIINQLLLEYGRETSGLETRARARGVPEGTSRYFYRDLATPPNDVQSERINRFWMRYTTLKDATRASGQDITPDIVRSLAEQVLIDERVGIDSFGIFGSDPVAPISVVTGAELLNAYGYVNGEIVHLSDVPGTLKRTSGKFEAGDVRGEIMKRILDRKEPWAPQRVIQDWDFFGRPLTTAELHAAEEAVAHLGYSPMRADPELEMRARREARKAVQRLRGFHRRDVPITGSRR